MICIIKENTVNLIMVIKMKKYIILAVILALITSIILGVYIYKLSRVDDHIAFDVEYTQIKSENTIENTTQETHSSKNKTTPNTKIIEKIYYNECGHIIQREEKINESLINKDETEIQTVYTGWEVQKFTSSEIVVYKEVNDFCDEHYLLKDVEGEIVIFKLDKDDNEKEIIRETGIQTKYLSEVDIENLKQGIKIYGDKELGSAIQDYE